MKFLVDAQLPRLIVVVLKQHGYDALHTLDLPQGNRTSDAHICQIADAENRIVISKDADFIQTYFLKGIPEKLLIISVGNISNRELANLLIPNITGILSAFETASLVELTRTSLLIHQ